MAAVKKSSGPIEIMPINRQTLEICIIGISPLITQPFSQKAQRDIEEKQKGQITAKKKRQPRNPEQEFEDAQYRLPDGRRCLKATAIKKAMINACSFVDGVTKVLARGAFFVLGEESTELIPIVGPEPQMRTDPVRVGGIGPGTGSADMRYRPEYWPWAAIIRVEYDANNANENQIVGLLDKAGFHVGLHEMRPEKTGMNFGRFRVTNADELKKFMEDVA